MKRTTIILVSILAVGVGACSNMSNREQRLLSGGAIGAASGAAIGGLAGGSAVGGAILGGAAGTAAGYLYDRSKND